MYLKRIEMKGFKSFANRTILNFEPGITCVVGPNGSGKSNISDAIKWVLGEQSSKELRGEKMEDVIFAGTHKRKATGYAEISLVLDNEDQSLPVDYSEVAITRRLYRSGESVYAINRKNMRLKDIRNLLYGTGLGVSGYSIVGQGKIDHILSKDSSERRAVFEEAVGIAKIKAKKDETQRKLERTEQNLERVQDILIELEQQLTPLQAEAEEAKEYKRLFESMRSLDVSLVLNDHENTKKRIVQIKERKAYAEERLAVLLEDRIKLRQGLSEREAFFLEKEEALKEIEQEAQSLQIQKSNVSHESDRVRERESYLESERLQLSQKEEEILALREEEKESYAEINEEFNRLNQALEDLETELGLLDSGNEASELERKTMMERLEQDRKSLQALSAKIHQSRTVLNEFKEKQTEISGEKNRYDSLIQLQSEKESAKEKELEDLMEKQKQEADRLMNCQHKVEEAMKARNESLHLLQSKKTELEQTNRQTDSLQNKIQLEERAISGYEGYFRGVRQIMKERDRDQRMQERILGVVTDLIHVEPRYQKAVETALGNALQNIVVRSEADLKAIIGVVKQKKFGRITILPLELIRPNPMPASDQSAGMLASEAVHCDPEFNPIIDFLLARTFVAETMDDALAIAKETKMRYRVVTVDGNLIRPGGAVSTGELNREGGLLERKNQLSLLKEEQRQALETHKTLEAELSSLTKKVSTHDHLMQESKDEKDFLEIQVKTLVNQVSFLQRDHETMKKETRSYQSAFEQLCYDFDRISSQIDEMEEEIGQKQREIENLEDRLETGGQQLKELERQMLDDLNVRQPKEVQRASLLEKIHHKEFLKNEFQNRMSAYQTQLETLSLQAKKNREERIGIQRKIHEFAQGAALVASKLEDCQEKRAMLTSEIQDAKRTNQAMNQRYYEIDDEISELKDRRNKDEVGLTKSEMQEKQQVEYLWEQYQMSIAMAAKMALEEFSVSQARVEVKSLKRQIRDLGEVNLGSIQKYEEVNERFSFLSQQQTDLLAAKKDLEAMIHELVQSMEASFLTEMEAIRKQFIQTFTNLFGGGNADIILEDPEEPLTTPIRIVAQPPGKKLANISALSGGEKALTAIALLFAIIQLKPTPFCVLDEIEAALDDANIQRFTDYLQANASLSQFIVITHKQETMRAAATLYGVTMQEKGVSSVLSVKLEELETENYLS